MVDITVNNPNVGDNMTPKPTESAYKLTNQDRDIILEAIWGDLYRSLKSALGASFSSPEEFEKASSQALEAVNGALEKLDTAGELQTFWPTAYKVFLERKNVN